MQALDALDVINKMAYVIMYRTKQRERGELALDKLDVVGEVVDLGPKGLGGHGGSHVGLAHKVVGHLVPDRLRMIILQHDDSVEVNPQNTIAL